MRAKLPALIATAGTICAVALAAICALAPAGSASASRPSYVALGDSYASGDGTGVFYRVDASCYRSPDAYPARIAAAAGYALTFAACSGATTADVESSQRRELTRQTALVTLQVGGNDAGFVHVLEGCALHSSACAASIQSADAYIDDSLPAVLDKAYAAIHAAAPRARVVVVGYPRLFTASGATCGFHLLSRADEQSANHAADLLDGVLQRAAASHGFLFVDPRAAFAGHEICSKSPWLQNITLPLEESYHPNIAGETGYAQLIERSLSDPGH